LAALACSTTAPAARCRIPPEILHTCVRTALSAQWLAWATIPRFLLHCLGPASLLAALCVLLFFDLLNHQDCACFSTSATSSGPVNGAATAVLLTLRSVAQQLLALWIEM
jgi:hypothetical protein